MNSPDPWNFKTRMQSGETLWGAMITLPSPSISEALVRSGFDWFFIDGEHGALEISDILGILQAVSHRVTCLVRVPHASEVFIKKVLDLGTHGIIVPQVNDAETARKIVQWSHYPPAGSRGVGLARAHGYGADFQEYVSTANQRITVMVQAEHRDAVDNIESIVAVEGIDAIQLGPFDLSASLGKMGDIECPEVTSAIDRVCDCCRRAKMPIATFGVNKSSLGKDLQRGASLICVGTDTLYLQQGAARLLDSVRNSIDGGQSTKY